MYQRLLRLLQLLIYGWLLGLVRLFRSAFPQKGQKVDDRQQLAAHAPCIPIDEPAFVRPDPLIYSQRYLRDQGLAVTWDNPDIQLYENGVAVSSRNLKRDTLYEVRSRIWNNSFDAPVFNMPVQLSYLDFGVGTTPINVGSATTSVGVKGGANHPAFVSIPWRSPDRDGHYCLQVQLDPIEDRNGANNLGQENTDVGRAQSPAQFEFALRNDTRRTQTYRFEVDAYEIGELDPCDDDPKRTKKRYEARHGLGYQALPAGWTVDISPVTPTLGRDEQITVTVVVTPPVGWSGSQTVNVNAIHDLGLAGGVTLIVEGSG